MLLVKNGVAESRAMEMDRIERVAWLVAIGRSEGGVWNWDSMEWEKRDG